MLIKQTGSAVPQPVEAASEWIQIFPAGASPTRDGRAFVLADPDAVIAASIDPNGIDLVIDRDHIMDLLPGQPAPAAGWIKELATRDGAIWAKVEWTAAAKQQLADREYRYISPTFFHDKKTGRVTKIIRASLVNDPAFPMKAVAAALSTPTENGTMDEILQSLAALLGLEGDNISQDAVLEAVKNLKASVDAVKETVDAPTEAETPEAITQAVESFVEQEKQTAAREAKATASVDPAKYVPVAQVAAMQKQLNALTQDRAEEKATAAVDAAIKAGKLVPALREWGVALASSDMKQFEAYVGKAPSLTKSDNLGMYVETAASDALSHSDAQVAAALGISPDKMKAAKA